MSRGIELGVHRDVRITFNGNTITVHGPATIEIEESLEIDPDSVRLTPTERAVFEMMRRGKCNKEIAVAQGTEVRTVKFHVTAVLRKLLCESRAEVILKYGIR